MYVHILLPVLVQLALSYTTQPPCCRDHIGASTCQRLRKSYPRMFSRRCNTDVEFRYVNSTDVFEPQRTWTCEGENPQIAFRACRKSCGFCDLSVVDYTLEKAEKACKKKSSGWREKLPS